MTLSPLRFMNVWGLASTTGTPHTTPAPSLARIREGPSMNAMDSSAARRSRTSKPALCLVATKRLPRLPRPTMSQRRVGGGRAGRAGAGTAPLQQTHREADDRADEAEDAHRRARTLAAV